MTKRKLERIKKEEEQQELLKKQLEEMKRAGDSEENAIEYYNKHLALYVQSLQPTKFDLWLKKVWRFIRFPGIRM